MVGVGAALQRCRFDGTRTGGRQRAVDVRIAEQLLNGVGGRVTVKRIGILIAHNDKALAAAEAAILAGIVVDVSPFPWRDVIRPEADLVMIAQPIAVLGAIEGGRCWMRGKDVDNLTIDQDRNVPVALR